MPMNNATFGGQAPGGFGTGATRMNAWKMNQTRRKRNLGNRADTAFDRYMGLLGGNGGQIGGGLFGSGYGRSGYGDPSDPRIRGHMQNMASGTRNIADDMVQRMNQQAGGGRGMRTATGTNQYGQMMRDANRGLARDYADRYGQAVGFTHQSDALNANLASNLLGGLSGLVGNLYNTEVASQGMGLQGMNAMNQRESELYRRGQAEDAETRRRKLEDEYLADQKRRQAMMEAQQRHQGAQQDWMKSMWGEATMGLGNSIPMTGIPQYQKLRNYYQGPGGPGK